MKIVILGASCTGKTSIAVPLAEQLGLNLRSCGEAIKAKAKDMGIPIDRFSSQMHSSVDKETLRWVESHDNCVVEGRFLDLVLSEISGSPLFIRLVASTLERSQRMQKRTGIVVSIEDIHKLDDADQLFRISHYGEISIPEKLIIFDTSNYLGPECVNHIKAILLARQQ